MISVSKVSMKNIIDAAESTYPEECCGLLVGNAECFNNRMITRVVPSPNLSSGDTRDSFEVDPKLRFDLMRNLAQAESDETIIGHYHSHPDSGALPSANDIGMAYEPDLVWVILAVHDGIVSETRAHMISKNANTFIEIPLRVLDIATEPII